jgi:hypothetical protein
MSKYPMLQGVDEDRVAEVGGKAAILEEIVKRWRRANIPEFRVCDKIRPSVHFGYKVFRASSELDIFGGCGLHETYSEVSSFDYSEIAERILEPELTEKSRLEHFARSVGKEYRKPTIIMQEEGKPRFWAVVMQHPNNPDIYLVNYADGPSPECKRSFLGGYISRGGDRETFSAVCDSSGNIQGEHFEEEHRDMIEMAVINHMVIEDLGIVHPDWASILEAGLYEDRTETYQFTPIRKRAGKCDMPEEGVVIGKCDPVKLPVVNIPPIRDVGIYIEGYGSLSGYPDFKAFLKPILDKHGSLIPPNAVTWHYMEKIEARHPQGYIVVAKMDKDQEFDIGMKNAKAVIIDTPGHPLKILNHNGSRLMYKSPVLIADRLGKEIPTGEEVTFSCDGTNYSIEKGK